MTKKRANVARNLPKLKPEAATAETEDLNCLSSNEMQFLRNIVRYSKHSISPAKIDLFRGKRLPTPDAPLSVSTISTSLLFDPYITDRNCVQHFKPVTRGAARFRLFAVDDRISLRETKDYLEEALFETAASMQKFEKSTLSDEQLKSAHRLIVINEFGFPFPLEPRERVEFMDKLETRMMNSDDRAFWESCYVVFGTYHDHDKMTNEAVISLPYVPRIMGDPKANDGDKKRIKPLGDDVADPSAERFAFIQEKFAPAEKIGEKLRPKDRIDWSFYDTDMGRIAVLICFDALDARMLIRLALWQIRDTDEESERLSAIIVPSFSSNDVVRESCITLSAIMKTLVVYVNFQYSAEVDDQVQPANRENFRKRAHGYFYDGQDIGKDDFDPIQVSDIVSKSHDEDKNLWYSRRHSIVERAELNRLFDIKTARSKPFSEIFDVNK